MRRDGIDWPMDEDGLPVYKLEELTKANGVEHGHAHDAMSDVHATVGMARLIKQHQPRLFEYYFNLRQKKKVRAMLEPYGAQLCVHVSGIYPRIRSGVAPIISIGRHPTNSNSILVVDLAEDIEPLLTMTPEEILRNSKKVLRQNYGSFLPFLVRLVWHEGNINHIGLRKLYWCAGRW